ncbi:MAG: amidase [Gammaproteobacteria bacterium]|nr:MAG: amidase [Gammaproteobacteria bacterium]
MFKEYTQYDGLGLAELIQSGKVSAAEVLEAAIARADALNPKLNAIIHRFDQRARTQLRDLPSGAFHGVPFLLKDLQVAFAGERMSMGSRGIAIVPDYDSELVRRFKAAGLNTFGKTNTPEFGLTITTEPKAWGATHNPHRQGYSSGGSSGGSAAAVAAGIVPLAGGGDGGGSIRFPASWCGVFGLKPSRGRNPLGPDAGEGWEGAVADHVLTRSVRDSAAMLDATAGAEPGAPYRVEAPTGSFLAAAKREPKPLRIALSRRPLVAGTELNAEVLAALELTAKQLEGLGHQVEEADPSIERERFWRDFMVVVCGHIASLSDYYKQQLGHAAIAQFEPGTKNMAMLGRSLSAADFVNAKRGWHEVQLQMGEFLQRYDVMLCPTVHTPAVAHGTLGSGTATELLMRASAHINIGKSLFNFGLVEKLSQPILQKMAYTLLGNVSGLPCMSVPLHLSSSGLPIGLQFIGNMCDEATLFSLAGQLERNQGFTPLPLD